MSGTGITNGTKIIAGALNYCVLLADSTIKCWGENAYGQLGNGTTTNSSSPVTVSGISNATDLTANGHLVQNRGVTCALLSDKGAKCWGANGQGQAGSGSTSTNSPYSLTTPTLLHGL